MAKPTKKRPKTARPEAGEKRILKAVLAQVPRHGWTDIALEEGLKAARVSRVEVLFPGGIRDVIRLFGNEVDQAMEERIAATRGFAAMKVREKVAFGVRARLEALEPYREAMKRLIIWYAIPVHAPEALKRLYKTVDLIWAAAGDTSTDYNFYTKRLLLAAVLKTTMLYWQADDSKGRAATWQFLDRRINEVVRAGKAISLLKELDPSEVADMVRRKVRRA